MDINTAYKGLVYLAIWVISYFAVRYILSRKDFEEIDMILIASIVTILIIVIDITVNKLSTQNDKMYCTNETFSIDATQNSEGNEISTAIAITTEPKEGENTDNPNNDTKDNNIEEKNKRDLMEKTPDNNRNSKKAYNQKNNEDICQKKINDLKWYEQVIKPRDFRGAENLDQIATTTGTRDNLLVNQMIYSDFNRLPPSLVKNDYEYGYSFMPPKDWYPTPLYPPVCVTNNPRTTMPVYLDTTTMDLKDWHETTKITPPDSINTRFIIDELNSQ